MKTCGFIVNQNLLKPAIARAIEKQSPIEPSELEQRGFIHNTPTLRHNAGGEVDGEVSQLIRMLAKNEFEHLTVLKSTN